MFKNSICYTINVVKPYNNLFKTLVILYIVISISRVYDMLNNKKGFSKTNRFYTLYMVIFCTYHIRECGKMTNNELLLAISDMMDQKLDTRLKPIEDDIRSMKEDIAILKTDVAGLKTDVAILKTDVAILKTDVDNLKTKVTTLENDVIYLKNEFSVMKTESKSMREEIQDIKLFQENVILPRLNTIESCYTDTYNRYRYYNDKMQTAFDDIELLKKVVAEHSEKLKNLA